MSYADGAYSIESPGADLANFPNSAFTLPQGKIYLEVTPVNYSSRSVSGDSAQFNISALLRYGLIENLELRLVSDTFVQIFDDDNTKGLGTQGLALKWHVADEKSGSMSPAVGVEFSLGSNLMESASQVLPALSLNFDQTMPLGLSLEYNVGIVTQTDESDNLQAQLAFSWAVQRAVFNQISAFIHGYTETASGTTASAIGGGIQWIPSRTVSLFANVNFGLTRATPEIFTTCGFAIAF